MEPDPGGLRAHVTESTNVPERPSTIRAPEAPMDVQLKNSGFEASKMTKSLSVDSGFEAVEI